MARQPAVTGPVAFYAMPSPVRHPNDQIEPQPTVIREAA